MMLAQRITGIDGPILSQPINPISGAAAMLVVVGVGFVAVWLTRRITKEY